MRNHYDMQREVTEAARDLFIGAAHCGGDTSGLHAYKRKLAESARRFDHGDFTYLKEIGEHVSRLQTLNAIYDGTPEGEAESICDEVAAEEDWLLDQSEIFNNRFRRLLTNAELNI
jgi:hypothetical protein